MIELSSTDTNQHSAIVSAIDNRQRNRQSSLRRSPICNRGFNRHSPIDTRQRRRHRVDIKDGVPYHIPTLMLEVKGMVEKARRVPNGDRQLPIELSIGDWCSTT